MNSHHSSDASAGAENPAHTRVVTTTLCLGNRREHFPFRLYDMLEYAAADDDLHSIVSWSADGLSFSIHQKDIFIERIVPRYFKITKFRSFVSTITIISRLLLNLHGIVNLYWQLKHSNLFHYFIIMIPPPPFITLATKTRQQNIWKYTRLINGLCQIKRVEVKQHHSLMETK